MNYNLLLISALVIFIFIILKVYFLFLFKPEEEASRELTVDEAIVHANALYDNGLHIELQRFLKKELIKKFKSVDLRKILIRSYIDTANESLAALHLDALLKVNPNDIESKELLADIYYKENKKIKALTLYEQIHKYDPSDVVAIRRLSELYTAIGAFDKANEMYMLLIRGEDDEKEIAKIKNKIAALHLEENKIDEAISMYRSIIEDNPTDTDTYMKIAELSAKKQDWETCLKCYQELIRLKGESVELLEQVAHMYFNLKQWDSALASYSRLIDMEGSQSKNYLHYQNRYSETLIHQGKHDESIEILTNLIADFPDVDSLAYTLAHAYVNAGRYQDAIKLHELLIEKLPPDQTEILRKYISTIIASWATDIFETGEYAKAFEKFMEGLKYDQDNAEIYYKLGKCNCSIKSYHDAIAHFNRAIQISPTEAKHYIGLGHAYDEMGELKKSRGSFQDAVNINPIDINARKAYALALTKELEYQEAIEQFSEILKFDSNDADTIYNLALCYEVSGNNQLAIEHYKKVLKVQPEHLEASHNLNLLNATLGIT